MVNLFFSYSHRDESFRDELEVHLSMLKRQGIIETWHDRRIGAGKEIDHNINEHLENANIILLLVSPYFIASDYCYDVEMERAMERHKEGVARVIPVILHPCDWHHAPFGKLRATPKDGKPISKFPNPHEAFLDVTLAIREAASDIGQDMDTVQKVPDKKIIEKVGGNVTIPEVRSSNLRIKKQFSDRDKDQFLLDAFEYIANYFEGSLNELKKRNSQIDVDFRRIDTDRFGAAIYAQGSEVKRCAIKHYGRNSFPSGITYSTNPNENITSYNESLSLTDDGYNLYLKASGITFYMGANEEMLTYEGAAEYLWSIFIKTLQ